MLKAGHARARTADARGTVTHDLYGIRIRTPWPVAGVAGRTDEAWDVEFVDGDVQMLAEAAAHVPPDQAQWWAQAADLPDGSSYRRWTDLFEFLVTPDARRIHARILNGTHEEALLAYLLVDALSFSMVRLGWEPLHATAVVTPHGAAAFLGESGDGKSTLAALFLHGGFKLLTDDMLVLTAEGDRFLAQPGPPRIKLYREIANRIFGAGYRGVPMNAVTDKLIIPLSTHQHIVRQPQPLTALYLIHHDKDCGRLDRRPVIQRLSPAEALPRILAGTAGHCPSGADRLQRQFAFVTRLVQQVPIKTLWYQRKEEEMFTVRDAVLADLAGTVD
ncbi:MAG TPA: hypothetical protein VG222_15925 [Vicinamibacterales bacterium]|jgi:hypothetical protein|nr:hypothetical protein [Vicinamibacterales bacterium]